MKYRIKILSHCLRRGSGGTGLGVSEAIALSYESRPLRAVGAGSVGVHQVARPAGSVRDELARNRPVAGDRATSDREGAVRLSPPGTALGCSSPASFGHCSAASAAGRPSSPLRLSRDQGTLPGWPRFRRGSDKEPTVGAGRARGRRRRRPPLARLAADVDHHSGKDETSAATAASRAPISPSCGWAWPKSGRSRWRPS